MTDKNYYLERRMQLNGFDIFVWFKIYLKNTKIPTSNSHDLQHTFFVFLPSICTINEKSVFKPRK